MRPAAGADLLGRLRHLPAGWRALLAFWAGLLLVTAGGAGLLAWIGPPPGPAVAALPAGAPEPQATQAPEPQATQAPEPRPVQLPEPRAIQAPEPQAIQAPQSQADQAPMSQAIQAPETRVVAAIAPQAGAERSPVAEGPAAAPQAALSGPTMEARPAAPGSPPPAPEPPPLDAAAFRPAAAGVAARPIPPADPALLESGPHGPLPRVGPEGRSSIRAYGRAFDRADQRPRIGLVIGGLGLNAALTEEAIRRLPGTVTLGFSPYARHAGPLLDQARARGMEVLVALPLEPAGHPTLNNAGDRALLTGLPPAENQDRLDWALSRFTGYVGAIGALGPMRGERFAQATEAIGVVQDTLHGRGLLYIDPRPPETRGGGAVGGPRPVARAWGRAVDIVVDEPATRGEIELKLAALERLARERGVAGALGYAGEASPVLVDRVAAWAGGVEARGFALAPVTALIRRPEVAARQAEPQAVQARVP